jgi:DNA-binding response OmpR family regulator
MPFKGKRILIVEDEPSLIFTLRDTLESEGYVVEVCDNGIEAVQRVQHHSPDLLILDLMLPGKSGYEICKQLRDENYLFPIIMLTARNEEIDKVTGLNIGADDYITKPFGVKELLARIQARLRRSEIGLRQTGIETVYLGPIRIDLMRGIVFRPEYNGSPAEEVDLTTREIELIRFMATNPGEPVSRDALLENVWRYEHSTNTRTVDVHISKLRSKIEVTPDDPTYLVTLHGVGYMLKISRAE